MHTGVDWAAPIGTPIYASGNGTIEKVGWEGGYGKYIRMSHANGYETAYGHMTAFARGMDVGTRVRQGQVIGFVGSTGLSTGAHVHYEILVNGRFVDPMRIKLPRGRVLDGPMLASFEQGARPPRRHDDAARPRASRKPAPVADAIRSRPAPSLPREAKQSPPRVAWLAAKTCSRRARGDEPRNDDDALRRRRDLAVEGEALLGRGDVRPSRRP